MSAADKLAKVMRLVETSERTDDSTRRVIDAIKEMDDVERVWAIFSLAVLVPPYSWERMESMPAQMADNAVEELRAVHPELDT